MMTLVTSAPFISFAQNREDVVLWRALGRVAEGRYLEVGANHPRDDSATRAFYDRGWSGVTVEPVPEFAALQRAERPRDHLVEAAVSSTGRGTLTLHVVPGTGLSTLVDAVSDRHHGAGIEHVDVEVATLRLDEAITDAGWTPAEPIHFALIDVEGAEEDVLRSIDLSVWRPWVVVVESTAPNSSVPTHEEWEHLLLGADYRFCLFDGLSRFYVAAERAAELGPLLGHAACVLDHYLIAHHVEALEERDALRAQLSHWRTLALTRWADAVAGTSGGRTQELERLVEHLASELAATRQTLSWRVTRPLRGMRSVIDAARGE